MKDVMARQTDFTDENNMPLLTRTREAMTKLATRLFRCRIPATDEFSMHMLYPRRHEHKIPNGWQTDGGAQLSIIKSASNTSNAGWRNHGERAMALMGRQAQRRIDLKTVPSRQLKRCR
jgi:hypothetical protein